MAYQIGNKYYHNDIESGAMIEISKKTFEAMNRSMDNFYKYLNENRKIKGSIAIHSTSADDFDSGDGYKNIWNDFNNDKK
jgi:hypothetical protein